MFGQLSASNQHTHTHTHMGIRLRLPALTPITTLRAPLLPRFRLCQETGAHQGRPREGLPLLLRGAAAAHTLCQGVRLQSRAWHATAHATSLLVPAKGSFALWLCVALVALLGPMWLFVALVALLGPLWALFGTFALCEHAWPPLKHGARRCNTAIPLPPCSLTQTPHTVSPSPRPLCVPCRVVPCRVVPCRVVPCCVVSCRAVSRRVVSCRVMSCRSSLGSVCLPCAPLYPLFVCVSVLRLPRRQVHGGAAHPQPPPLRSTAGLPYVRTVSLTERAVG